MERLPTARTEVVAERICEGALAGGKPATGPRIELKILLLAKTTRRR